MKITIIYGSPRKGNTWRLVERFKEILSKKEDISFEEIFLSSLNIPTCLGCYSCFLKGEEECPYKDYIQPIVQKIESSDGIIITSPVYALNVSGLLKNFFDHTAYLYHRPRFFNKKALVIVTTVGQGAKRTAKYINETLHFWGFNRVYNLAINCYSLDYKPSLKVINEINRISEKFYRDLKYEKLYSPSLKWIIIYNVWRALAFKNPDENFPDKKYWIKTNLINHSFAPIVKIGKFKQFLGNLFFKLFKIIIKF